MAENGFCPQAKVCSFFLFCHLLTNSGSCCTVRAPSRDIVSCSWARHFTLTKSLSTQVYKWVLANLVLGVALRWTNSPSRGGSRNTSSQPLLAIDTGDTKRPDEPIGSVVHRLNHFTFLKDYPKIPKTCHQKTK